MSTLHAAALAHLQFLRVERNESQDALYVRLAFTYGVEVPDIVQASGLSLEAVRAILGGSL